MSFFKEFKEDLSEAVSDLLPEEELLDTEEADTNEGLLDDSDDSIDLDDFDNLLKAVGSSDEEEEKFAEDAALEEELEKAIEAEEEEAAEDIVAETVNLEPAEETKSEEKSVSDEAAVITKGTTINGDIESDGSLEIVGTVVGNVACSGKLIVTGTVTGNSKASEFFADEAKINGEVVSEGTAKVGVGSIIIGNITATSAVIAGAVKGDIDVKGPVVIDSTAIVMGDIHSKSVQINNGAVIEGFVSQTYADVNAKDFFEQNK
ncbi:bactofilin family protein [Konateibacter massiliensis]|uniref:bactofilin family protein n=1 Tax=Konateibacter massiliensis TaxID=2002841 RepID=UPI000C149656|nr:polymer-forming cytoskeletal protein [Konateibacter massiliensis]